MQIRQEIALALKCQIPVPGFKVSATLEVSIHTPAWGVTAS